mgnify:CR=1 FL=1
MPLTGFSSKSLKRIAFFTFSLALIILKVVNLNLFKFRFNYAQGTYLYRQFLLFLKLKLFWARILLENGFSD